MTAFGLSLHKPPRTAHVRSESTATRKGEIAPSAIDFDMQMELLPNPKGDRVKITMSGKFLLYKYYGNSGNIPDYGFKEE